MFRENGEPMKNILLNLLLPALIIIAPFSAFAQGKGIYGEDGRQDYFQVPGEVRQLADSVVSLWRSDKVTRDGNVFALTTRNFGQSMSLCPDERFYDQPKGAFCSGVLVGEDMIMTSGHCIADEAACSSTKIVFGFAIKKEGETAASTRPAGEVYGCKRIIESRLPTTANFVARWIGPRWAGPDYALIRLDRKVSGHKPLPINRKQKLAKGDRLFAIGHPSGLPLKVAGDAKIRDVSPKDFFMADLDTYEGNSGSPVFSAETGLIEGVLFDGGEDFVDPPVGCKHSYVVAQEKGEGEYVTRISVLADLIPGGKAGDKAPDEFRDMRVESLADAQNEISDRFGVKF